MKVELQSGDTIAIPEGCKAIVKGGSVVFEKIQEFKDGDVLHSVYNDTILIFKEEEEDGSEWFYSHYNTDNSCIGCWYNSAFRHATEEEKQQLFDKMKEQGLRWNAEEKRVEKIRWRAKKGEAYYRIDLIGNVFCETDRRTDVDNMFYDTLNHFRTEEQTKEAAKRVKEVLRKYHEEIGE